MELVVEEEDPAVILGKKEEQNEEELEEEEERGKETSLFSAQDSCSDYHNIDYDNEEEPLLSPSRFRRRPKSESEGEGEEGEGRRSGSDSARVTIQNYYKNRTRWEVKMREWGLRQLLNWKMWVALLVSGAFFAMLGVVSNEWKALEWRGWFTVAIVIWMMVWMIWEVFDAVLVLFFVQTLVLLVYYTWDEGYCYCGDCVSNPDLYSDGNQLVQCTYRSGERAVEGYSNNGVMTVGILFVVAKGIEVSSLLRFFTKYVLGKPATLIGAQIRLLLPTLVLSAFLNNTPIVAMLIPVVQGWSVQCKLNVSRLLMPLSFAAIMGGTCSLIGTSTNVIVAGLVDADPTVDFSIGFFSIATLGIPTSVVGLIYLFIFSRVLLPKGKENSEDEEEGGAGARVNFTVPVLVTKESGLIGKNLTQNGLCTLQDVELFKIVKKKKTVLSDTLNATVTDLKKIKEGQLPPSVTTTPTRTTINHPPPDIVVEKGDVLYFSGQWDAVQLVFFLDGVVPNTLLITEVKGRRFSRCIVHVVLSQRSSMVGQTILEANFPVKFNAAVVAISRQDLPVLIDDLGDVVMEAGDVLVLEATTDFVEQFSQSNHFALVSERRSGSFTPRRISFTMITVALSAIAMVTLSAAGVLNLVAGAFLVAALYIIMNVLTWDQAKSAVNVDVLFIIAAAFGLGNLMQDTCVANAIATSLLSVFSYGGQIGVLVGLYFSVALMSCVISNAACVTLMYPIAINFSLCTNEVSISQHAAIFTLMMAGSAAFATPIGYQTNLMVMTPGKYVTTDFLKFGIPLTFLNLVVVCFLAWTIFPSQC